jgi:predicted amidohydrolase YtcJ
MPADRDRSLILSGGTVRTFDDAGTVAEAIGIERGSVRVVGTTAEVAAALPGVPVIDLAGRTVLPGFIDAHAHIELSTMAERLWVDVRFCDPAAALERIAAAAAVAAPGEWIVGQGTFGQRLPTREELDLAAPGHPVLVRESMHLLAASSVALAAAGIDRTYAAPHDSRVLRRPDGEPTGEVREGFDLFPRPRPSVEWLVAAFPDVTRTLFVEHGVTTICELPASIEGVQAWKQLQQDGRLPCRLILNPILAPGHQPIVRSLDEFLELGATTGWSDPWLMLGALKLFVDGGDFVSGFYRRQLSGPPQEWGILNFHLGELVAILTGCRKQGVQAWMHAIGDAAQDIALAAVEEVNRGMPASDHRTRIEHIGNHVFDPGQIDRIARAGVVPVPNAVFIFQEEDDLVGSWPEGSKFYPFRSLVEQGLATPGNSDCAGTQPFAANPWFAIHSMLVRRTKGGAVLSRDERVDLRTAVETYTRYAAYAAFEESSRGSLEVGKLGDLAVYPDDPFDLEDELVLAVDPDLTVIGGDVVFDRSQPAARTSASQSSGLAESKPSVRWPSPG